MAGTIAAHQSVWECMGSFEDDSTWLECSCRDSIPNEKDRWDGETEVDHAAHVAVELAKAGYGNAREAEVAGLLQAVDEMPIESLHGADKASVWLRQRAHSLDQEGHTLVQAIHDRKAEA